MLSSGGLAAAAAGAVAAGAALYALSRLYKRSDTTGSSAKVVVVLGGQWGDEGKGKLVDILAQTVQVCARFNGGANAGHTLVVEGKKYAFHLVPCGMMNRASKNLIGNGVVVHIPTLLEELAQLKEFDPAALSRLFISDRAAVLLAFEAIGGCQAAMDAGMAYTKERYAFGRPVASFQAIKHKFADMFVALELARANAYYGAWALSVDAPDLPLAAATARVSATDAYWLISKENLQAQGGMGFTWEFDCHLYYRRAQGLSSVIGTLPEWKDKLATRLLAAA